MDLQALRRVLREEDGLTDAEIASCVPKGDGCPERIKTPILTPCIAPQVGGAIRRCALFRTTATKDIWRSDRNMTQKKWAELLRYTIMRVGIVLSLDDIPRNYISREFLTL